MLAVSELFQVSGMPRLMDRSDAVIPSAKVRQLNRLPRNPESSLAFLSTRLPLNGRRW